MSSITAWVSTLIIFEVDDGATADEIQEQALALANIGEGNSELDYAYNSATDIILAPSHHAGKHVDNWEAI